MEKLDLCDLKEKQKREDGCITKEMEMMGYSRADLMYGEVEDRTFFED
jgi:hypothetical protein